MTRTPTALLILIVLSITTTLARDQNSRPAELVVRIQRADYEGNRDELKRLYEELAPFLANKPISSRVRYWRGFALWRRALNGFNESVDPAELEHDLDLAVSEFKEAGVADPHFADAKVGQGSCLSNLIYLNRGNPSRLQNLIPQARQVLKEAELLTPDNPRLAWVVGPNLWYASQQDLENQRKAIEIYKRGLETIRKQKDDSGDILTPSWGEPELLMSLAWSNLHLKTPDLQTARTYAQSALTLVPYWHYVKDILIPQIENAIGAAEIQKRRDRNITAIRVGDFETLKSLFIEESVVMLPSSGFVEPGTGQEDA